MDSNFIKKNPKVKIIDNSSVYRMDQNVPLIIPEINSDLITTNTRLISNPNCSTAQLVMVLFPLDKKYKIKRVVVSTYQSVSGAGYAGIKQLFYEGNRRSQLQKCENKVFNSQIDLKCISFCDQLVPETGYTKEELKLENETKKLIRPEINLTATAVRVPVLDVHCESVNIEFENEFELDEVKNCFQHM